MVIVFPFLGAGFANIPPTFLISCEVQTRTLKYSEQYIRDHLAVTKVIICICSEYDDVFNLSYIAFSNLTKSCTFPFISFLSKELDSEFSNSQSVLCKLLKYFSLKVS